MVYHKLCLLWHLICLVLLIKREHTLPSNILRVNLHLVKRILPCGSSEGKGIGGWGGVGWGGNRREVEELNGKGRGGEKIEERRKEMAEGLFFTDRQTYIYLFWANLIRIMIQIQIIQLKTKWYYCGCEEGRL